MKKKIILGVSLFLMLLTLFALSISGAEIVETWDISETTGDNVTATLYDDYSLVISGTGAMKNWTSSSSVPWYSSYRYKIKSVTIEDSVTTVGDYAFDDYIALTSVVIGDSVTTIGKYAFSNCDSLTSVVIPDSVTTIGFSAFRSWDSLTSVVIPDSVTTIDKNAFAFCHSLTSIVIPDSVTSIGSNAFIMCDSLTIYAEDQSQPSGWASDWNSSNCPVVWGYFDKEASLGEIFTFLGYSFNEEGSMAVGFEINYEALRLYEEKTGETLEIGVVFAGYSLLNGNQPLDSQGNEVTLDDGAVVKFDLTEYDYTYYDFVITDIIDSIKDIPLVISAYINNGLENKYIQDNGISDTVTGISYNEAKE